jgi:hypothetical protein
MFTSKELRTGVYEIDGTWRDIYVLDTTQDDWRSWMTFVNQHYRVCWGAIDYQDGRRWMPLT